MRKFLEKLSRLSPEEHEFYRRAAYKAAFFDWNRLTYDYRAFVHNLFTCDWQQTLDYLRNHTVLGMLAYPLREPEMLQRFIGLTEGKQSGYMPLSVHLAFCLSLAFPYLYSIEYFGDPLKSHKARSGVKAVLDRTNVVLVRHLQQGRRVCVGELGNFRFNFGSTGVKEKEKFATNLIREPKVRFLPRKGVAGCQEPDGL